MRFILANAEHENNIAVSVYASVLHLRGPDSPGALTRRVPLAAQLEADSNKRRPKQTTSCQY